MRSIGSCRRVGALTLLGSALWIAVAAAQEAPYAGHETREIKSLSATQMRGYLDGEGMGLALAAELNGFPGPKHALELRQELGLSLEQLAALGEIFDAMHAEATRLGAEIVERERQLDAGFSSREIDAASIARMTVEIGRLNGSLRGAHLQAHLKTAEVLSLHQRMLYDKLRGYASGSEHGMHH
jgi:hypothetical protein